MQKEKNVHRERYIATTTVLQIGRLGRCVLRAPSIHSITVNSNNLDSTTNHFDENSLERFTKMISLAWIGYCRVATLVKQVRIEANIFGSRQVRYRRSISLSYKISNQQIEPRAVQKSHSNTPNCRHRYVLR